MLRALQGGPWFVNGSYLSLQRWSPNFVATEARPHITTVWIRLPNLPTEFYDGLVLQKIGNKIEKLVKIDACTSATIRGRYDRLCLEVPMDSPVRSYIYIGKHRQLIQYEGEYFLCKNCGRLGQTKTSCPYAKINSNTPLSMENSTMQADPPTPTSNEIEEEWHTVSFSRRKPSPPPPRQIFPPALDETGIKVRIFYADTGKFLNTQNLKYFNKVVSGKIGPNKHRLHSHKTGPNLKIHGNTNQFAALQILPTDTAKTTSRIGKDSEDDQCMEADLEPLSNSNCHVASPLLSPYLSHLQIKHA
ncbi:PREDICTED: uncharacterized protein LOC109213973 [Nicotiana attenuata]|uniref:uncharacterized protein LOC109213973 n=1 Tax=Nicotiana attenuata TaxID=49451 RepID=UPI000904BFE6|nr:PREDICTED: uncharacterized protein LOC109213973 [Nicotiana attenuata]